MSRPLTLITGGTRGIGAATAHRLAADGHDLVLGYAADYGSAEETARAVRAHGHRVQPVAADITSDDGVALLFERASELGTVTGVVNNAGATIRIGRLVDAPVEVIRRTVDLNLTAALLCARAAVRVMSTSRGGLGGVIVNVSSGAATLGAPHEYVQYAAAKAGIDALTVGLAIEVASEGIRVVAVAPGIRRDHDPRGRRRAGADRAGRPDGAAGACRAARGGRGCDRLADESAGVLRHRDHAAGRGRPLTLRLLDRGPARRGSRCRCPLAGSRTWIWGSTTPRSGRRASASALCRARP